MDLRGRAQHALGRVPLLRRLLQDLIRIEVIDRSMALAAQALLALVPVLVVAAAFLPEAATQAALDRMQAVTGVGAIETREVLDDTAAGVQIDQVRAQMGLIGIVVTILSSSSYALAMQRCYERVWSLTHAGGLRGRRRCLGWLLAWLVGLEAMTWLGDVVTDDAGAVGDVATLALRTVLASLLWWWSFRFLLSSRRGWRTLLPAAALTGVAVVAYTSGSTLVMPTYAATSAAQFGAFGVVLALATWLVGFSGVLVVAAVVGRAIAEEPAVVRALDQMAGRAAPA